MHQNSVQIIVRGGIELCKSRVSESNYWAFSQKSTERIPWDLDKQVGRWEWKVELPDGQSLKDGYHIIVTKQSSEHIRLMQLTM